MFKKTMKFDDLDGNEVTETFYFNYNKKEVAELLEFGYLLDFPIPAGETRLPLEDQLKILQTPVEESGLSQVENNKQAYSIFQGLILDAYGEKGANNVTFEKNERLRNHFKSHVAFVELIFEFLGNPKLAATFIENCLPPKAVAAAKKELQEQNKGRLSSDDLASMVEEAERRQQDPATRIEPGPEAAAAALGENKEVAALAAAVAEEGVPEKRAEDMTVDDVRNLDDVAFKKLDVRKLSKEAMFAAFERKNQG